MLPALSQTKGNAMPLRATTLLARRLESLHVFSVPLIVTEGFHGYCIVHVGVEAKGVLRKTTHEMQERVVGLVKMVELEEQE